MQKMELKTALFVLVLAVPVSAGCRVLGPVDDAVFAWEADLPLMAGGLSGSAAALSQGGSVHASIQIGGSGELAGVYHWRIRVGSCSNPGSLIGGLAQYPELHLEPPRSASADAFLTDGMPDGSSYSVVVLKAADDAEVACGDFSRV